MIQTIIERLLTDIEALNYVDLVGGIVRTQKEVKGNSDNAVVKVYPVCINSTKTTCSPNDYINLSPDSSKKGIIYFEDKGTSMEEQGNYYMMSSQVRLVGWFNLKLINTTLLNADTLLLRTAKAIPKKLANSGGISAITIECTGNEQKSPAIFSEYTFTEEKTQYTMYPFDYFAINYLIEYKIHRSCINDITLNGTSCY